MKRLLFTLTIALLVAGSLWANDDEIVVTRQLTHSQSNSLPDKTITVETKRLTFNKKADPQLVDAITQVLDTIAREDYQNRTFVLLIENTADGQVAIAAHSDDIITQGRNNANIYYGNLEYQRYNFVVLLGKDNLQLLEKTFKRQGKVKFIQEFEFVDFKTPSYPTNVIGRWAPGGTIKLSSVIINEYLENDRGSFDSPARVEV